MARFLALLELFREAAIAFEQAEALGELTVRWTGSDEGEIEVSDEFDESDEQDEAEEAAASTSESGSGPAVEHQNNEVPREGQESSDD